MRVQRLTDNVFVVSFDYALVNSSIIVIPQGVVVIDTLLRQEDVRSLDRFVREELKRDIRYVINTHYHSDHIFGNQLLEYEELIAHENYKRTFETEKYVDADDLRLVHPTIVYSDELTLSLGDTVLQLFSLPGHSMDSTAIYLPSERLLFAGDNVLNGDGRTTCVPYFIYGSNVLLQDSLEFIKGLALERIVPGHGVVCGLDKVDEDIAYLKRLTVGVEKLVAAGASPDDIRGIPMGDCLGKGKRVYPGFPDFHGRNLEWMVEKLCR